MKRKINRVGTGTLTVSLPSKWATKYGLKQGDEVEVEEEGNNLAIGTEKSKKRDRTLVHIPSKNHFIKRLLFVPYTLGYNEIKVTYDNEDVLEEIQRTVDMMMGFEVMEQGNRYCVLKCIATEEADFDDMLRRLIHVLKTMGDEIEKGISNDSKRLKSIPPMRRTAGKITLYCRRLLHTKGHSNQDDTIRYYQIVNLLGKVAIHYRDLSRHFQDHTVTKHELKLIKYVVEQFNAFIVLLYDEKRANSLNLFRENTYDFIHREDSFFFKDAKNKEEFYTLANCIMILDKLNIVMMEVS